MSRTGCRVYIGNLSPSCIKQDLEQFFKGYGHLTDILIKQGYGFVEFENYRDADDAVYDLDGRNFMEKKVRVEHVRQPRRGRPRVHSRYGPPIRTNHRVIVKNLSSEVSWQDLKDLMRKAGDVTYVDVHKDRRNEGVVEFASRRDMERAIYMFNDYNINGRRIWISEDRKIYRETYSRSRSYRSRSHSRTSYNTQSRKSSSSRSGNKNNSKSGSESRSHSGERKNARSRSKIQSRRSNTPSTAGRSRSQSSHHSKASSTLSKRSTSRDNSNERDSKTATGLKLKSSLEE